MDNKNQEPIVLGTIKKGRTGKPIFAIIIILLIGAIIYFLPQIQTYFKDESIIELIKDGELINYIKNGKRSDEGTDSLVTQVSVDNKVRITDGATLTTEKLFISDIKIDGNKLSYSISSKGSNYDASNQNLYLQILEYEKVIYTESLDRVYTSTSINVSSSLPNKPTSNDNLYLTVKTISEQDIEEIVLSSDESGLASLICTKDNDQYEYIFSNKNLIEIKRVYKYEYDDSNDDEYTKEFEKFDKLQQINEKNNIEATIEENISGFTYKENIDLKTDDISSLDNNYFALNTKAKVVNFKQEAKGFDCQ